MPLFDGEDKACNDCGAEGDGRREMAGRYRRVGGWMYENGKMHRNQRLEDGELSWCLRYGVNLVTAIRFSPFFLSPFFDNAVLRTTRSVGQ